MPADDSGGPPLVSGDIFDALQSDLDDPDTALQYLLNYLQMWDGRFLRLSTAIGAGDAETAKDAVLSVRTSARMIGALRLAQLGGRIEQHLAAGNTQGATSLLGELEICGRATMDELRRRILPRFDPEKANAPQQRKPHTPEPGPEANVWLRRADSLLAGLSPTARWEPGLS